MKLEPGKYKIHINNGPFGTTHFLYVYRKNAKLYYRQDHGMPQEVEGEAGEIYLEHTRIIKNVTRPVKVKNLKVTVTFEDEDGDEFSFSARNIHAFKRIFKLFPGIGEKFDR